MAEKVEILIKIPKYYLTHPQDYSCLAECVRRGVLLPKEHGRLKDIDKIEKLLDLEQPNHEFSRVECQIEAINEIEKPDWMETSEKAHYIRKKRNLVHANLCLKKSEEINEETCKKVIEYLEYIIDTRFDKSVEKKNNKKSVISEVDSEMGLKQIETF